MTCICVAVMVVCMLTPSAAQQLDPEALAARGVTFYASFDGTTSADYARGNPHPIAVNNIEFVDGRLGQAVYTQRSKEVELGKVRGRASSLNFDAAGHLFGERGTLAYWFQPQYDLDDPTIRSGSGSTGPYLVNVSAVEDTYYQQFIRAGVKGGAFYFWVVDRDGNWHGLSYGEGIQAWKRGDWHHIVMTWDATAGMRFYDNGVLKYSSWGDDPFPPATPYRIGVGTQPPVDRPGWTWCADAVYDELVLLERAVSDEEVAALMEGRYLDLQPSPPFTYTEAQLDERRRTMLLEEDPNRPVLRAEGDTIAATIARAQPTEIRMRFIRSAWLADGRFEPAVNFAQGGLTMTRDVTVALDSPANQVEIVGRPAEGEEFALDGRTLHTSEAGAARAPVSPVAELTLHVPGGSEVGEVLAWRITPGAADGPWTDTWRLGTEGRARDLACVFVLPEEGLNAADDSYADAAVQLTAQAEPLLRRLDPEDRRVLLPGEGPAPTLTVPATRRLCFAGPRLDRHQAVRRLRLVVTIKPNAASDVLRITVPGPYDPTAFYFTADLGLDFAETSARTLDVTIDAPGMIFPRGSRPLMELTTARGFALAGTPELRAELAAPEQEGEAFARDYLRLLNEEFTSRMGLNFVYYHRGIDVDNALTRGLFRVLSFDPDNALALDMLDWARIRPWPPFNKQPEGPDDFPALAKYAREAALEARDVIHWWIDERVDETGYVVGRADMWNDDTKLFNEYSYLWLLSGDEKLAAAMEKYLDAHWASGRMAHGWSKPWTDIVHSAEEASYLEPTMALVRYGDPVHLERLMETASNVETWTGITGPGHRHFRSNFFTADRMKTEGEFGRDVGLNATALTASMFLAWYCGHPTAGAHVEQWARAWVEDALAEAADKPAGAIPAWVDFATHTLGPAQNVYLSEITMMMEAAWEATGDRSLLAAMAGYLQRGDEDWLRALNVAALSLRREMGPGPWDDLLLAAADDRLTRVRDDSFFQRGMYYDEVPLVLGWMITGEERYLEAACFDAWRDNWRGRRIYTELDPHKDRVYPWGRYVLPWMSCGGNALNGRGSAPWPNIAVSWDAGYDFAALVRQRTDDRLRVTVWNFGEAREIGMRTWGLPAGRWRLSVTPEGGATREREVALERGLTVPIELPARTSAEIELTLVEPSAWSPQRADLALSSLEAATIADGQLTVTVHNVGALDAPACRATLMLGGRVLAEAPVPALDAPVDFVPRTAEVQLAVPTGATGVATVIIDADDAVPEITELNNRLTVALP